jgi:polyhydroxyalkanoate synthesis regulator phasin
MGGYGYCLQTTASTGVRLVVLEVMAQNDMLKRYLDAGIAFTQMTRARAEEIITELVKAGEIQRDQVQSQVDELIERSRRNTDQLVALVRQEVTNQFSQLPLATKDDLKSLERWLSDKLGGAVGRASSARSSTRSPSSAGKPAAATRPASTATNKALSAKSAATKRPAAASTKAAKAAKGTTTKATRSAKSTTAKASTSVRSTTAKTAKAAKKTTAKKASPSGTGSGA